MRPVSERWARGVRSGHRLAVLVKPVGGRDQDALPFTAGTVNLDRTAETRARCDLTFTDLSLIPDELDADAVLGIYGAELEIWRGLYYPGDPDPELVRLGIFRNETVSINDSGPNVEILVSGLDRSARSIDLPFEAEQVFEGGDDYLDTVAAIVREADPGVQLRFVGGDRLIPTLTANRGDERWRMAQGMAEAIGCELYYDADGFLVLAPMPSSDKPPVAHLVEGGNEDVTVKPSLTSANKTLSRTETKNRWIVVGNNPEVEGEPPVGTATDDNPTSPTYYDGPFGRKPDIYESSFIVDDDQAQDAAEGRKREQIGAHRTVEVGAFVDPALEPGDVVRVTRTRMVDDERVPIVDENHVIDSLSLPLTAEGGMTASTRATHAR